MIHRGVARTRLLGSALSVGGIMVCPAALAQQSTAPGDPSPRPAATDTSTSGAAVGTASDSDADIVVTARKTNERLQDVPITLNALSGNDLRNRSATDVKDVLRSVPGFSFTGVERGQAKYNIRGVSTSAFNPTVGVYLDDISLVTISTNFSGAFDPVFFDMERLEVLKGPQGTLYGGSAMGGAIKYVSARPNLVRTSASVTVGGAGTAHGDGSYNGDAVLNLPLVQDHLAVRGGIFYRRDGGFIDNLAGGPFTDARYSSSPSPTYDALTIPSGSTRAKSDQNDGNTLAARFSLEWQPDPSWTIRPQVFYQDYKLYNPSQFWFTSPGRLDVSDRLKQPTRDRDGVYSLDVNKTVGQVSFTSLTAYFTRNLNFTRDYSFFIGGLIPAFAPLLRSLDSTNISTTRTRTFSQEARLQSAAGPDARFTWLFGGYYSHQTDRLTQIIDIAGAAPLLGTEQAYDGFTGAKTDQYAAFGEVSYRPLDRLTLTAGLRAFQIKQTIDALYSGPLQGPTNGLDGNRSNDKGVNPKFGVSYKLSRDNLFYVSATKGFRPGGPNRFAINSDLCRTDLDRIGIQDAPGSYKADHLWQYEAGSKNSFANGRGLFNVSAFYTDWKGIQQLVNLNTCGFSYTANAGTAHLKGAEGEAHYDIVRGLQIGGNVSYVDGKILDAIPGTSVEAGDRLQAVPKWTTSAYTSYKFPFNDKIDVLLRADYQYQSRARLANERIISVTYADGVAGTAPNFGEFRAGYQVVNAFISVGDDRTNVRVYVNNLLDNRPLIDRTVAGGSYIVQTLRPRTVGVEVHRAF